MAITRIGGANAISGSITSSNLPTGTVLQVQSTAKLDVFSTTSTSFTDVTGLSAEYVVLVSVEAIVELELVGVFTQHMVLVKHKKINMQT